jgi:hypothetical protein
MSDRAHVLNPIAQNSHVDTIIFMQNPFSTTKDMDTYTLTVGINLLLESNLIKKENQEYYRPTK